MAELIGYLVKGPKKIKRGDVKAAALLVLAEGANQCETRRGECEACGDSFDVDATFDGVENIAKCKSCDGFLFNYAQLTSKKEAIAFVDELIADWPPMKYRDAIIRTDPDDKTQWLVCAGDMSWGEVPDGLGYEALAKIMASGVSDLLGIR